MLAFSCNNDGVINCRGLSEVLETTFISDLRDMRVVEMASEVYLKMCSGGVDVNSTALHVRKYCSGVEKIKNIKKLKDKQKIKTLSTDSTYTDGVENSNNCVFESISTAWFDDSEVWEMDQDAVSFMKELDEVAKDIVVSTGFDLKKCLVSALDGSKKAINKLKVVVQEENISELILDVLGIKDVRSMLQSDLGGESLG